jgi:predicted nucleic acid-binding protein
LIFIHTDALLQILDKKSNKGQELFEKLEKSKDVFAIASITLYDAQSFLVERELDILPALYLLQVCDFSKEDVQKSIEMEFELKKKKGKKMYMHDLMACATVINKGGFLCTMDNSFEELKEHGLKLFFV